MGRGPSLISLLMDALTIPPWNSVDLSRDQMEKMVSLLEELLRWNRTFSFTSLSQPRDLVEVFLLDSMAPLALGIDLSSPLLDAGCGVGFPSLPLKMALPSLEVVAVDASRKKINFLRHVVRLLRIQGYTPRQERLENLVKEGLTFPSVTVRALTRGGKTQAPIASLVNPQGKAILYVGREWSPRDLPQGLQVQGHLTYTLPFSGKVRGLVLASRVV